MGTTPFSIRLDDNVKHDLEIEAKRAERSASWLAASAIKAMLANKARERQLLEAAIAEADLGEFISSEAMTEWFASIDTDNELAEPEPDVNIKSGNS